MNGEITIDVEVQARTLCNLLGEYEAKLRTLFLDSDMMMSMPVQANFSKVAWWMDEVERSKRPFLAVLSRASQLLEHSDLESITQDEIALRLASCEVQLHHVLRQLMQFQKMLASAKYTEVVDRHRISSGLPVG
jgi:hypothetical protein